MQWIKKNLFFVLGGAIALVLMVLAILYVLQSMKDSSDTQEEINGQVAELQRLHDKDPFPSEENIVAAKEEQKKAKEFLAEAKVFFTPVPSFPAADNQKFQEFLGSTIFDLQKRASMLGVILPPQYAFSFSGQRNALQLSSTSIEPWLTQLAEVRAICNVLYDGKINELYSLRRVAMTDDDRRLAGSPDYIPNAVVMTNQTAIFAPYEIVFRGFSADIANVMSGFVQSSNCFIVKSISVEPAPFTPSTGISAPGAVPQNRYTPPPVVAGPSEGDRYGALPSRTPLPARPAAPTGTPGARPLVGSVTVLSERPLRVTMVVETVKLRERK